jgi:hypothetical protein
MKLNGKWEVLAYVAQRGFELATLLVVVLACAMAGRAQSSATTAAPPKLVAVNPSSPEVKSIADSTPPREAIPKLKRSHEGITVHGHWTIEIKNPDGKLAKHVEFENALAEDAGSFAIASLLSGASVSGGMAIGVNTIGIYEQKGATGGQLNAFVASGFPIAVFPPSPNIFTFSGTGPCSLASSTSTGCLIFQGNANGIQSFCNSTDKNCFANMNVSAPTWFVPGFSQAGTPIINPTSTITLGGNFLASASNPVVDVEAWIFICTPDGLAGTCANVGALNGLNQGATSSAFPGGTVPSPPLANSLLLLTTRNLDGKAGDPAQVTVTAGQTVSVNVALSFN